MKRPNRTSAKITALAATLLLPVFVNGAAASAVDGEVFTNMGEWCDQAAIERATVISAADKLPNTKRAFITRIADVNSGTRSLAKKLATLAPSDPANQQLFKDITAYLNGRSSLVDNVIKKSKAGQIQQGLLLLRKFGPEHAEIELNLQRRVYQQSGTICAALVELPPSAYTTTTTATTTPTTTADGIPSSAAPTPSSSVASSSTPVRLGLAIRPSTAATSTTPSPRTSDQTTIPTAAPSTVATTMATPAKPATISLTPTTMRTTTTTIQTFDVGTATTIPVSMGGAAQFLPISQSTPLRNFNADEERAYRGTIQQMKAGTAVSDVAYRAFENGGVMFVVKHEFYSGSAADEQVYNDGVVKALSRGGFDFSPIKPIGSFSEVRRGVLGGHSSFNSVLALRPGLYVWIVVPSTQDETAYANAFLPQFRF